MLVSVGALPTCGQIEPGQRLTGAWYPCDEATDLPAFALCCLDRLRDVVSGTRKVFCTSL